MKIMKRKWKDNERCSFFECNKYYIILSTLALVRQKRFICKANTQTNKQTFAGFEQTIEFNEYFFIENCFKTFLLFQKGFSSS